MVQSGCKDFRSLIGTPFVDGGRDPATGLDCWGLFMAAARIFGHEVRDFKISCFKTPQIYMAAINEAQSRWTPVALPMAGDAVTMALDPDFPGFIQHFGVMVDAGRFLHTLQKTGAILTPTNHPFFKGKITGYLRPHDSRNGNTKSD